MPQLRLDKILADSGAASRREARLMIKNGLVTVDGEVCREADRKVDTETSRVCVEGKELRAGPRYFIMYKPLGVVTATEDRYERTVLDLLPPELRKLGLVPAGRLDKDTSGLLILTNDGAYLHQVISPRSKVYKTYLAAIDRPLDGTEQARFAGGIVLGDGTICLPAELDPVDSLHCRVTVCEGKYHQVRRMFAACGRHVETLHRESIGALTLGRLTPGSVRELDRGEEQLVFKAR